jgi:ribosomal protein L20
MHSLFGAPLSFVPNSQVLNRLKDLRIEIDYRILNNIAIKNYFLLPLLDS